MAANDLVYPAGWGLGNMCSSAQGQALQVQAAKGVNRTNTKSGALNFPIIPIGSNIVGESAVRLDPSTGKMHIYDDANAAYAAFSLDRLPDGMTMAGITVKLMPAGGHVGAPATLPRLRLFKCSTTGVVTEIASFTYVWVDVPTYEAGIALAITGLGEVIDLENSRYYYEIRTEAGGGSVSPSNLEIQAVLVDMTIATGYAAAADFTCWMLV